MDENSFDARMGVNFKIYKDSFESKVRITDSNNGGKIVKSVTENDPTFKFLCSTWIIDPIDKVRLSFTISYN